MTGRSLAIVCALAALIGGCEAPAPDNPTQAKEKGGGGQRMGRPAVGSGGAVGANKPSTSNIGIRED